MGVGAVQGIGAIGLWSKKWAYWGTMVWMDGGMRCLSAFNVHRLAVGVRRVEWGWAI